jgi:hypothetical protein
MSGWCKMKCLCCVKITGFLTPNDDWKIVYCDLHLHAPELLDACKRLLEFNENLCEDINISTNYPSAKFARSIITKAKGNAAPCGQGD